MPSLYEMTDILRSKQAGPFELTLDAMFASRADFLRARDSGVVTPELIASLYSISTSDVRVIVWSEQALALKITIPRSSPSGDPGERDVYGAQQHSPLESVHIP